MVQWVHNDHPDWYEPGRQTLALKMWTHDLGIETFLTHRPNHKSTSGIAVLLWILHLLFGGIGSIWPLVRLIGWRRRRQRLRREIGLCLNCGYDLRASRERCPECGVPVSAKPDSANETEKLI